MVVSLSFPCVRTNGKSVGGWVLHRRVGDMQGVGAAGSG